MKAQRGRHASGLNVRAKQLLQVFTGRKYLGGTQAPQAQGHQQTTSQMKEVQQLKTRHDTTTTPLHHLICAYGEKQL